MNCLNCGKETKRPKYCSNTCCNNYWGKNWRANNKEKISKLQKQWNINYRNKYPWLKAYNNARRRCLTDKKHSYYMIVEFNITKEEVKYLWFRDNAGEMKQPSIDRINPSKGYILDNCRFMELKDNQRRKKWQAEV